MIRLIQESYLKLENKVIDWDWGLGTRIMEQACTDYNPLKIVFPLKSFGITIQSKLHSLELNYDDW